MSTAASGGLRRHIGDSKAGNYPRPAALLFTKMGEAEKMMSDTGMNAAPPDGRAGDGRRAFLALRLLELAIGAGWNSHDCIEFAREAHKFVTSTQPEAADQSLAGGSKTGEKIAVEDVAKETAQPGIPTTERPKWGPDIQTKRKALQALADQNLMIREAAEVLGVSQSVVASTAHKLKIRFHGRRGKRRPQTATPKATSQLTNGTPAHSAINGAVVAKLLVPVDRGLKRRCPSCNQVFEAAKVSHYLCDDCEGGGHAGRS